MADFSALKTAIQTYIKQNGNEEITGEILQEILLSVVTTLGDTAINNLVTALADEVAARQNADGTLQQNITNEATARGNADTALQGLIDGITGNIENGYVYAGIATPSSTPTTGKVFYIALTAGTYTNFGSIEVSQGINILKYNGSAWSLDAFIGIDDTPTPNSPKLVKSGGAFDSVMTNGSAFDISAHFASGGTLATYADLNAALAALNTLSASYKRGGMSIKFVQSSDNKYVQYRLMADEWSTDIDDWEEQKRDIEVLIQLNGIKDFISVGKYWNTQGKKADFSTQRCISTILDVTSNVVKYKLGGASGNLNVRCFDANMNYLGDGTPTNNTITLEVGTKKVGFYWTGGNDDYSNDYITFSLNANKIVELYERFPNLIEKSFLNLFNINALDNENGFIAADGTITSSATYLTSEYISVNEGAVYYPAKDSRYNRFRFAGFYNSNKEFISRLDEPTNITIPQNAKYLRVTYWNDDNKKQLSLIDEIWFPYNPITNYLHNILGGVNSLYISKLKRIVKNINYISDSWVDNEFFSTSNGVIYGNESYARTGYIEVDETLIYRFSGFVAGYVCCYDASYDFLGTSDIIDNNVSLLSGTRFIGINFMKQNQPLDYKERGVFYNLQEPFSKSNVLDGKKWCVVGDSFSQYSDEQFTRGRFAGENVTYKYLIAERNNMNIVDMAVGGRTMAYPNDHTFDNAFAKPSIYQSIPSDVDYITIMLGINDGSHYAGYSPDGESTQGYITLGTIDSVDTGSFYGAWNVVLDWIFTNRPYAHVGILITNGMGDQYGAADEKQHQLYQAILDICQKWNVPHINMNGGDGKTPMMQRGIYPEGTPASLIASKWNAFAISPTEPINGHTNAKGHRYESTFIENFLRSL